MKKYSHAIILIRCINTAKTQQTTKRKEEIENHSVKQYELN